MRPRRRPPDPEAERRRAAINAELVALTAHPSWPELEAEVGRRREEIERQLLHQVTGNPAPVNQREIDFKRGVLYGMTWLITRPRNAELTLERYLREQGELTGEE